MAEDVGSVKRLMEVCDQYEGLELPLNLATPDALRGGETDQLLYEEDGVLMGYLTADHFSKTEVCLAVHPEHRRGGIGSALLTAARERCRGRGVASWLLVCDEASASGREFVRAMGAEYRFAEYRMELDAACFAGPEQCPSLLSLRPASTEDVAAYARLKVAMYGGSEEKARQQVAQDFQRPNHQSYLVELGKEPIGTVRAGRFDSHVYITAVGIHPEHRGRGYGRWMLSRIIADLLAQDCRTIKIEVDSKNQPAFALYRSCGFREQRTYGYYRMAL
jgi:ribosomal protein S18 acetylase RimI-like enzyme